MNVAMDGVVLGQSMQRKPGIQQARNIANSRFTAPGTRTMLVWSTEQMTS